MTRGDQQMNMAMPNANGNLLHLNSVNVIHHQAYENLKMEKVEKVE